MSTAPKLVAWDFDGVLNRNIVDGRFIWADGFETALGVPVERFVDAVFRSGAFDDVLVGRVDLRDLLAEWCATDAPHLKPERIMAFWFKADAHADDEVLGWITASPARHVIATNNEQHRADYIWGPMGFADRMERMFAAGPMGVRKPDDGFFRQIEVWSGLAPSEILLIDDAEPNITAARALGWRSHFFNDATRAEVPGLLGIA